MIDTDVEKYHEFLQTKIAIAPSTGRIVTDADVDSVLFPFQRDLTRYALRKGRAALLADTGLGKTLMQVEWARLTGEKSLIFAPLTVAGQTVRDVKGLLGITVKYARNQAQATEQINIANYEMMEHFNMDEFGSVVLDESSILKSLDGKTKAKLTEACANVPNRLCCSATPAPNDIAEIANHAEFLGIMTRAEMLAMFFVHDDGGWRLKKHAEEPFYRWLASWALCITKPSDLGYSDEGYILPKLNVIPHFVRTNYQPSDALFFTGLKGITDRAHVRKATAPERVSFTADLVNSDAENQWIIWCGLNDEAKSASKEIESNVQVEGSQSADDKISFIESFRNRDVKTLITKPRIAGYGLNLQNCHNMVFLGLNDSWEDWYQCIRRCYRFGQTEEVNVHVVLSEIEQEVWQNIQRKEKEAQRMKEQLIKHVAEYEKAEIGGLQNNWEYTQDTTTDDRYTIMLGDSVERLREVKDNSVGLSVFSPPFISLYTYSPTERDLGNSTEESFFAQFGFIMDELLRITEPGRNCAVHVSQVPAMLVRDGYIGMKDFRGRTISAFEDHGWIYHGEVCIDKDPQAQSIRTHSKGLAFKQLHKDSAWLRPALADYILLFRKPGDNQTPILPDITNDQWIEWARPIWYGIKETETLNASCGDENNDERHICPLQLGTIERVIRLWSNPDEVVCSPFMGIGSEGYMALKLGRRFVGCELKESYYKAACRNILDAAGQKEATLFDEDV